jgi:hypothetical protein
MLVGEVVPGAFLSFWWAVILYEQLFIFALVKQKRIVFAANNSRCCECHVAPTITLCFGLVAPTIIFCGMYTPESFGPIEGDKWFDHYDQISRQWESQKNQFASIYFGKIQFYLPAFEISRSCRTASEGRD